MVTPGNDDRGAGVSGKNLGVRGLGCGRCIQYDDAELLCKKTQNHVEHLAFEHFLLQPMDGPSRETHTNAALAYCKEHPRWRLSVQVHKILGIR